MVITAKQLDPRLVEFVRFSALVGFIVTATLVINLNHRAFKSVFKEKAKSYWGLFFLLALVPLLLVFYFFSIIFE
jgi:hypothetical protein